MHAEKIPLNKASRKLHFIMNTYYLPTHLEQPSQTTGYKRLILQKEKALGPHKLSTSDKL